MWISWKITVSSKLELVKIVAIDETSSCDLVPQSSSSRKESAHVELTSRRLNRWNVGGLLKNVSSVAHLNREG